MKFCPVVYTWETEAVIFYKGHKYFVKLDFDTTNDLKIKVVSFEASDSELTEGVDSCRNYFVKWGGAPRFLQGDQWPMSEEGIPYDYLCTVENEWGDGGNLNVFILTEKVNDCYTVSDVYTEASCH
jgi:hypothetical protein